MGDTGAGYFRHFYSLFVFRDGRSLLITDSV